MKLRMVYKGGPGSGHHGHKGRPGKVGGGLPEGAEDRTGLTKIDAHVKRVRQEEARQAQADMEEASRTRDAAGFVSARDKYAALQKPSWRQISNDLPEGLAYIVHDAIADLRENPGKTPASTFIDAVENQSYYGSRPSVVAARDRAWNYYKRYLAERGIPDIEEREYNQYNSSQNDDEED